MDFNALDSRQAAETGAAMDIRHPVSGDVLMDGDKVCRVILRGSESPTVQKAMRAMKKAAAAKTEDEMRSVEEIHEEMVRMAAPLILGFENVDRGDKPATADDAKWFLGLNLFNGNADQPSFVQQVLMFASDRANYLGNAASV